MNIMYIQLAYFYVVKRLQFNGINGIWLHAEVYEKIKLPGYGKGGKDETSISIWDYPVSYVFG